MKGKKRFIVTMLFFINIIMLVAAVIPHHHHPNGMICMKQDQPVEQQCPNHHHHPRKRFMLQQRMHDPLPLSHPLRAHGQRTELRIRRHPVYGYDHRTFITTAGKTSQNYYIYRESLHGTKIPRTSSLRAPPYSVLHNDVNASKLHLRYSIFVAYKNSKT